MNQQDQIKALAELDGREIAYGEFVDIRQRESDGEPEILGHSPFPDYLTSYDAIIPLIQKQWKVSCPQNKEWAVKFIQELYRLHTHPECEEIDLQDAFDDCHQAIYLAMMVSMPAQLCEALLRATGKWKE